MIRIQERSEVVERDGTDMSTACVLCSHNCGLKVDVKDNRIDKVRADDTNPATTGYSCNKAYSIGHYVEHKQRLEHPLKRTADGEYVRISWDEAITEIAAKLNAIRDTSGPTAIALNGIGGQSNHMDALFAMGFMGVVGTPWYFSSYAQEKSQHHWIDQQMAKSPPGLYFHADAWNSDVILLMGTNPLLSNRGHNPTEGFKKFFKNENNRLFVVDPRRSETARRAHVHLAGKPGTDAYLLMAMVKHILDKQLFDSGFLKDKAVNFTELEKAFRDISVHAMCAACELDVESVTDVAEQFARAGKASIFYDLGVEQIRHSTLVSWLMKVLSMITGNYAQPGGNIFSGSFSPAVAPVPAMKPYIAPVSGIQGIATLAPMGMFSPYLLPEEIEAGNIQALIVEGSNPLLAYADTRRFERALRKLDLLVVIEPAFTETARVADYVLPTPTGYEKWEWCTFPKGYPEIYAQLRPPILSGPAEALPEAEIYSRLVTAMGLVPKAPEVLHQLAGQKHLGLFFGALGGIAALRGRMDSNKTLGHAIFRAYQTLGPRLENPSLVTVWLTSVLYALSCRRDVVRHLGPDYRFASPFRLAEELAERVIKHPEGVQVALKDVGENFSEAVRTRNGKVNLVPKVVLPLIKQAIAYSESEDDSFPYMVSAGERTQWTANTIQRSNEWRKGKGPHFWIKVSPKLAEEIGAKQDDIVILETAVGQLDAPVIISDTMPDKLVSIPNGFGMEYPDPETGELKPVGRNANLITSLDERDPITGCPYLKHQPCRVYKKDLLPMNAPAI
ncbi:molybdopterin-dependent oxidoreductase [Alcanivorax sp. 1008]|uniref:molybdopterin-containing oxidoreductase family protein n=1 Tax=Alcanivorax sp. 1008 TaxID=2816853 RepID=UPI001DD00A6B|nr:molybdopterin-dependent oxidoreductase [Alcanivorax sp. 1008]MCC1495947.1 molybdopterin-dependent oxidoreductase [Alcanivorax sp. 1008]